MLTRITFVWVFGLVTAVPYGVYYLFFRAPSEQYALLITLILFWIFGFWAVVGPILSAIKVRRLFKALETVSDKEQFQAVLQRADSEDALIDLLASENRIPKFIARKLYAVALKKMRETHTTSSR